MAELIVTMQQTAKSCRRSGKHQAGISPFLRHIIDGLPAKHKLNHFIVLYPQLPLILDCVARRALHNGVHSDELELLIAQSIEIGMIAADKVVDYHNPAWPMRVVEAFMEAMLSVLKKHVPSLPCEWDTFQGQEAVQLAA